MVLLRCTLQWTGILGGMDDAMRIDVDADFIVIFVISIALSFIGNVLLGYNHLALKDSSKSGPVLFG